MSPSVSVVMIVLNGERFIAEAINSVLGQTFRGLELIVVDDGSTDRTAAIVAQFAEQDARVRYCTHPDGGNHGMSASRNAGIRLARGEFIAFLDCDDVWVPHKIEDQVQQMLANQSIDMLYGRTLIWHSWDTSSSIEDHYYELGVEPNQPYGAGALVELLLLNKAQTPTTCNVIMRASLFRRIGAFEQQFRGMFEDQALFLKAFVAGTVFVSDKTWALYRQHSSSTSYAAARRIELARLRFLAWATAYLFGKGLWRKHARVLVGEGYRSARRLLKAQFAGRVPRDA